VDSMSRDGGLECLDDAGVMLLRCLLLMTDEKIVEGFKQLTGEVSKMHELNNNFS